MHNAFTPVILLHLFAALAAVALGAAMFLARKGTLGHRVAGRSWVALMLVVAVSSFWIRSSGSFSWIHILSVVVLVLLALLVFLAASGRIRAHQRLAIGVYVGALGITGLFTLLPHRRLGQMLWSSLGLL